MAIYELKKNGRNLTSAYIKFVRGHLTRIVRIDRDPLQMTMIHRIANNPSQCATALSGWSNAPVHVGHFVRGVEDAAREVQSWELTRIGMPPNGYGDLFAPVDLPNCIRTPLVQSLSDIEVARLKEIRIQHAKDNPPPPPPKRRVITTYEEEVARIADDTLNVDTMYPLYYKKPTTTPHNIRQGEYYKVYMGGITAGINACYIHFAKDKWFLHLPQLPIADARNCSFEPINGIIRRVSQASEQNAIDYSVRNATLPKGGHSGGKHKPGQFS